MFDPERFERSAAIERLERLEHRRRRFCDCGRAIRVFIVRNRRHSHNWNSWKRAKHHDLCDRCWRASRARFETLRKEQKLGRPNF